IREKHRRGDPVLCLLPVPRRQPQGCGGRCLPAPSTSVWACRARFSQDRPRPAETIGRAYPCCACIRFRNAPLSKERGSPDLRPAFSASCSAFTLASCYSSSRRPGLTSSWAVACRPLWTWASMKLAKCVPRDTDVFRPMSVLLLECQLYQLLVHAASGIASQGVCGVAAFLPLARPGAGMQRVLRRHPVAHSLALPGSGILCRVLSICACFRMRGEVVCKGMP